MFYISYFPFPGVRKPGKYFFVTARNKAKFDGPENIQGIVFIHFFIFMIEEHVSFHFQQISSWINRAFRMLFHFPESWKIRNFLLTAPNKANFDGSKYIFKSLFSVYFFIIMIERHVSFQFQQIFNRIIHVFDVLFNFPGCWKSRNCPTVNTLACPRAVTCHHHPLIAAPSVHAGVD